MKTMEALSMPPCREAIRMQGGRLLVTCHVTPGARREHIACEGGKLRVWLQAPPVKSAANEALIALLACMLHLPPRRVILDRGMTTRQKTVAIEGLNEQEFWRRLGFTANA
jgi:uncharacterized protein